jgi:predicted alpha/beta-fold hydrolase
MAAWPFVCPVRIVEGGRPNAVGWLAPTPVIPASDVFVMSSYVPSTQWKGSHRMTLYAWGRPRRFPRLPEPESRYFDVDDGVRVLAHCYWQAKHRLRPTVIGLHGLESSSRAHYMRGLADKAWSRGWNAVLLNQRNCGGTEHLCPGLYHSGLTHDPRYLLEELIDVDRLTRIFVVGYSLGGNLTLKLAGELGRHAPRELAAVCAVSPTMDLERCVQALERPANRLYEWNFVRSLKARMRRKAALFPGGFDLTRLRGVRTVRGFDEAYTAPHHGFAGASDYYYRASAARVIEQVAIPTLLVSSGDDPFVPPEQFEAPEVARNPSLTTRITEWGGHCGFVADAANGFDGYWAEHIAISFMASQLD